MECPTCKSEVCKECGNCPNCKPPLILVNFKLLILFGAVIFATQLYNIFFD